MVSVMNEFYCHKKIVIYFANVLQDCWFSQRFSKNFANFTGKHLCLLKCEHKSLTLSMKPASDFIFEISKSNKHMK